MKIPPPVRTALVLLLGLACSAAGRAELDARRALFAGADAAGLPGRHAVHALSVDEDGTVFAGARGLSMLGAGGWETLDTGGQRGFTAVAARKGRVYYASEDGPGYSERGPDGGWRHTTLEPALHAAGHATPATIRSIHILDTSVVFVTRDALLQWNGRRFTIWPVELTAEARGWEIDGAVHVFQPGRGLLRLGAGGPVPVWTDAALPAGRLHWLVPLPTDRTHPARGWLVGADTGVYRDAGSGWRRLPAASQAFDGVRTTEVIALDADTAAVATHGRGVLLVRRSDGAVPLSPPEQRLTDTSVHALRLGADLHLWIASERGLFRTASPTLFTLLDERDHLHGSTLVGVMGIRGAERLITRRSVHPAPAIFAAPAPSGTLSFAARTSAPAGRIDEAVSWQGRVWVRTQRDLWRETSLPDPLAAADARVDLEHVRSWPQDLAGLLALEHGPKGLLVAAGRDLWLFRTGDDTPESVATVATLPISWVEDTDGFVWLADGSGGVSRHAWATGADGTVRLEPHGRWQASSPAHLARVGAQVFALAGTEVLSVSAKGLSSALSFAGYTAVATAPDPENVRAAYWLLRPQVLGPGSAPVLFHAQADAHLTLVPRRTPDLGFLGEILTFSATRSAEGATTFWLGGQRGALRLGEAHVASPPAPAAPLLDRIETIDRHGQAERHADGTDGLLRLDAGLETISFHFRRTVSPDPALYFQTRLRDVESAWSAPQRAPHRSFTGLAAGEYRLETRVLDAHGRASPTQVISFTLAPPWWRHPATLAGALASVLLLFAALVHWRVRHLRRINGRLDRLVRERTRELELSNSAKSVFLENISHEIRNPLHGIVGLIGMLDEQRLPPEERDLTRSLRACAAHLHRVSEEVLSFSKLEYAPAQTASEPFRLEALVRGVVRQHGGLADRHGASLRLVFPTGWDDRFVGDGPKLATILSNFVANALKYAPGEPIVVSVEIADAGLAERQTLLPPDLTGAERWELVTLEVRDYGPGIPADEQELIFQKFVRGSNAKHQSVPGTGLGLAACRVLAGQLGARIGVHSAAGEGATFYVQLPLPRAPRESATPSSAVISSEAPTARAGRALIVDDEAYNRVVLAGMLRTLGYECDEAGNPDEARVRLRARNHTLVFLDWELPGGNGGELAREIRNHPLDTPPRVVATTAREGDAARRRCLKAGMDGFLQKPYDLADLRAAIGLAPSHTVVPCVPDALHYYAEARPDRAAHAREDLQQAIGTLCAALFAAADAGDRDAIGRAAHRLAGLAGTVGAPALNRAARTVAACVALEGPAWVGALAELRSAAAEFNVALAAAPGA